METIEIEERLALDIAPIRARCVDGARARPPEDVGGIPGYEHFLAVIGNPRSFDRVRGWAKGPYTRVSTVRSDYLIKLGI